MLFCSKTFGLYDKLWAIKRVKTVFWFIGQGSEHYLQNELHKDTYLFRVSMLEYHLEINGIITWLSK